VIVGIVSEPVPGHLGPALTVGRALRARGHEVVVFAIADVADQVRASGLAVEVVGADVFPPGALARRWLAHTRGARALVDSVRTHVTETEVLCRDVPPAARAHGVDVLLVDQLQVCGRYLAEAVGVPLVTLCAGPGLLRLADGSFPPPVVDRLPSSRRSTRLANQVGFAAMGAVGAPRLRIVNRWARRDGLPVRWRVEDTAAPDLQLSSLVRELNFDVEPPAGSPLRYLGPLVDDARPPVAFPWDALDGRPLVYASLGTVQAGADDVHRLMARACADLDVQLVVTLGGAHAGPLPRLPGDPIVVARAPQLDLLRRATLCLTHCGMNTTMECAGAGVPMVGLPIIYDQPAVAARIRHAGLGRTIPLRRLTVAGLRAAMEAVLADDGIRRRAAEVAAACAAAGGPTRAAQLIEDLVPPRTGDQICAPGAGSDRQFVSGRS
jgi:zeaxanthin glucosyltransferase